MVFGKKKTLSERMKDILAEVELLPEEDQEKFWKEFEDKGDDKSKVTTGEQIEEAKEDIAEKGKTEETAEDKVNDALVARIAALEEKVAKMLESEAKEDFGMKASLPQGNESDEHYDAVMRGYAKGAWRNYK